MTDKTLESFLFFLKEEKLIFPSQRELVKCIVIQWITRSSLGMASNHILLWREHLTQETSDTLYVIKWPYTCEKDVFDKECVFWPSVLNESET
jgi:hypothetical protein